MYERMLVAVDHSEPSHRAVEAAAQLAGKAGSEVFVLHLREREMLGRAGSVATEEDTEAKAQVDAAVAQLTEAGVRAHGEVNETLYGSAAREIVDSARAHDVSVIIMGSRGRGELAGLVLGSTAHKVLHLADVPVLIIR